MEIGTLYEYIEQIGVMTFSTIHGDEVHSRSAHFNGFDEEGTPYRCRSEYCDDCGSCLQVCPANAIQESLVF